VPNARVDSYIDATVRIGWRVDRQLELALVGRNLAAARRLEFISELGAGVTLHQRSVYLKASYTF
jgi:iron complex outermembrane receptor protein